MKRYKKWISILCVVLLVFPLSVAATEQGNTQDLEQQDLEKTVSVTGKENEKIIYQFLKEEFGLNTAAICGILANIYKESSFNSKAYNGNDTGETESYGLCQWNSGAGAGNRYKQLRDWCVAHGYDYTTVEGQLNFMKYELEGEAKSYYKLSYLQNYIENTAEGAYEASKIWSKYYEGCNKVYHEERAVLARDTYWTTYLEHPDTTITISENSRPNLLNPGEDFVVTGTVQSDLPLTKVTISIYDGKENSVSKYNAKPNTTSYDLAELGTSLDFSALPSGSYYYRVYAANEKETVLLTNEGFVVASKGATISDGVYKIFTSQNSNYAMDIASSSNAAGANVQLDKKATTLYQLFEIKHVGNGYYTIMNLGSEKYLDVKDAGTENATNVQQAKKKDGSSQKWQIIKIGNYYCFVPECAKETCLDLENGSASVGLNVRIWETNLRETQKFRLTKVNLDDLTKGEISVDDVDGEQGTRIKVPIVLEENLGIAKMQITMSYDSSKLKLVEITNGKLFELDLSADAAYRSNPYTFVWDGALKEDRSATGTLGTAVFEILGDAKVGETSVKVKVDSSIDYKDKAITIPSATGMVEILSAQEGIPGDVNVDGVVDLLDAILLRRYVADWDVKVNLEASDVDGNGIIDLLDAIILRRYVADWDVTLQ